MQRVASRKHDTAPYSVIRTPGGFVVTCAQHLVTDEIKEVEARALADALNNEFKARMNP